MIFDLDHQKPITPYGSLSHPFTPQVFPCRGFWKLYFFDPWNWESFWVKVFGFNFDFDCHWYSFFWQFQPGHAVFGETKILFIYQISATHSKNVYFSRCTQGCCLAGNHGVWRSAPGRTVMVELRFYNSSTLDLIDDFKWLAREGSFRLRWKKHPLHRQLEQPTTSPASPTSSPADRNQHLKALKETGLLEKLTVPQSRDDRADIAGIVWVWSTVLRSEVSQCFSGNKKPRGLLTMRYRKLTESPQAVLNRFLWEKV